MGPVERDAARRRAARLARADRICSSFEDDENAREALAKLPRDEGFAILQATDIAAARALLAEQPVEVMLPDLKLPDGDAQSLLDDLAVRRRLPPTIAMTAFGSGSRAIKAMRAGIEDSIQKPIDFDCLLETIRRITARRTTHSDDIVVRPGAENADDAIVGASLAMQHVYKLIGRVAQTEARVLIVGESGTGKELVAKEIHRCSARARAPFVAFNCTAVPETLLEAELFALLRRIATAEGRQLSISRDAAAASG